MCDFGFFHHEATFYVVGESASSFCCAGCYADDEADDGQNHDDGCEDGLCAVVLDVLYDLAQFFNHSQSFA